MHLLGDLQSRGLLHQSTAENLDDKLAALAKTHSIAAYAGFDPTADSLHVGNFIPICGLIHAQRNGIRPIAVVGGATGLIGDPGGKRTERQLLTKEQVQHNTEGIRRVLERFLDFEHPTAGALIVNNLAWFSPMLAIDFLRDLGKHFRVGPMLAKESVRARMADSDEGLSYTEFSYQLLQAYDFHQLYKQHRCVLQLGGSEQWGNITAGIETIRKLHGDEAEVFGVTLPLITTSSGEKFGKSEGNAVWLSDDRTSCYDFYQFWLRTEDRDAGRYLRLFTFVPLDEIASLERDQTTRAPQQRLALEMTRLVHGDDALEQAISAAQIMYGGAITASIDNKTLAAVFDHVPTIEVAQEKLADGWSSIEAAVASGLCKSKGEARRLITQGGFYVNNQPRKNPDQPLTRGDLINHTTIVLRSGKKNYRLVHALSDRDPQP